ncbi:MAG: LysR family transcriptional regulator [Candidatus Accumulibacter sp.]|jgi:DNA-binding transcriptional LysR family regulator|nr:LysR family transcriptional regulator [Accumulibacter sp.]
MTFTQLEIFVLVAELGSFTVAAEKLGISQSAVSHAIRNLEKEWGLTLLARGQAGIETTEVGQSLLGRVRELLSVGETIRQEILAIRGLDRGVLRVGSFGTTSSLQLLPRILRQFRTDHPKIDVFVEEDENDEVARWIGERRVDVGFVVLPDERFDTIPLVEDQFVALLPAAHPLAAKPAVRLSDLCELPFLMTLACNAKFVEKIFAAENLRPGIKHRYAQIITLLKMVESGAGASVVADLTMPEQIMALCPGVVKRPLAPRVKRFIGLAVPSRKQASPAVHAFLKTAKSVLAPSPG